MWFHQDLLFSESNILITWVCINRTSSVGPQLVPRTVNKQTNNKYRLAWPCPLTMQTLIVCAAAQKQQRVQDISVKAELVSVLLCDKARPCQPAQQALAAHHRVRSRYRISLCTLGRGRSKFRVLLVCFHHAMAHISCHGMVDTYELEPGSAAGPAQDAPADPAPASDPTRGSMCWYSVSVYSIDIGHSLQRQ